MTPNANDLRNLSPQALDALKEVANIGASHAATALSQIVGQRVMISVPQITVARISEIPNRISEGEEPIAAVEMKMDGDLQGITLLVFPHPIALRVAGLMMRRHPTVLGRVEESALNEAGNILSGAYLNALAEFLKMRLLNTPPTFTLAKSEGVFTTTYAEGAAGGEFVFCAETEFQLHGETIALRGFFLLLPNPLSLQKMLQAMHLG